MDAEKEKRIQKAINRLSGHGFMLFGNVADTLEDNQIYDRKDIKYVLDAVEDMGYIPKEKGFRSFIYDQMKLRKPYPEPDVMKKLKRVV